MRYTSAFCLELRSLPSPGVNPASAYTNLFRHPKAPGLSLTSSGLISLITQLASVLRALSFCTCCPPLPRCQQLGDLSLIHPAVSAFPGIVTGSACTNRLFEDCSSFHSLCGARTLARSTIVTLTLGFHTLRVQSPPWPASGCFRLERSRRLALHPLEAPAFSRSTPLRPLPWMGNLPTWWEVPSRFPAVIPMFG